MKKRFYQLGKQVLSLSVVIASTLLFSNQVSAQGVSINGTGTGTAPDASAILDLNVSGLTPKKGFLAPRVALTGTGDATTITSPATSLIVYNTATGGGVSPGFYYNSGTPGAPSWVSIGGSGSAPTAGNDIDVSGTQVDIEPVLDYVHTINGAAGSSLTLNAPFLNAMIFQVNGTEAARFSSGGSFGIGDNSPAALFTVGSGDKFQVDGNGNLIEINDLGGYSWPTAHASGVLRNNGTGTLTWGAPTITGVAPLTNGTIWIGNASSVATEQTMSGDVTITNAGVTTIQDNSVDGTDIALGTQANNDLMQYNGTDWVAVAPSSLPIVTSFSAINTGLTPNSATTGAVTLAGTLDVDNGGTGATTLTGMLKGNGTSPVAGITGTQWGATYWSDANTIAATAAGTAGNLLMSNGAGAPTWSNNLPAGDGDYIQNQNASAQATSNFWISGRGTFGTAGARFLESAGGTYYTTIQAGDQAADLSLILPTTAGSANQVLQTNGAGTLSWATTFTNPMTTTGDIIYGSTTAVPSTPARVGAGTAGMVLHTNGTSGAPTWAVVDLDNSPNAEVGGILGVGNGGTGVANPTANGILVGNGSSPVTSLTGTNMQTIRNNTGVWTANNNILDDNSTVGIGGLTTAEVTASTAKLDVDGDYNVGDLSLQLRSGNSQTSPANAVQIAFGYRGDATYRHNIRTSHNSGGNSNNSLNFYVWNPLTDASTDMGSKKVIEMDYLKLAFWGSLEPNGLPGTAGQVLASGGAGVSPTWVNASTGTVTSVTGTSPINVATGTTTPVISLQGAAGTIAYGTGGGSAFSAAGTVAGQILQSNTTSAPTWSTASYPATTAINTLLYSSAANTVTALPTANNSVLTTNGSGVPTWSTVASMNADLTVQNGLYLSAGTTYDGSSAVTIKQGGALTETTTITQAGFDMTHSLTGAGDFIVQTSATNKLIFDAATGNVGIGNIASPSHKLQIDGKVKSTGINETSDIRLKTNFSNIDGALNKVLSMNGKYYDWRTSEFPNKGLEKGRQVGVIAQEIEKILPEVVDTDSEGYKSVEYSHIVPVLIEAIKEQQKIIDEQKSSITDLKASLENVLNRINIIEENADINSSKVEK